MGRPPIYTDVERQMALDIYQDRGATAAAAEMGCSRQVIYVWLAEELSKNTQKTEAEIATQERYTKYLRVHLTQRLLYSAVRFVDRCHEPYTVIGDEGQTIEIAEPPGAEVRQLMTSAAIAIDKMRMELGESTSRTESVTVGVLEAELARLESEVGRSGGTVVR